MPLVGWLVENYMHSRYDTRPLQDALIEVFGDSQYLFGGQREAKEAGGMEVKVAVTATSAAGSSVVFANYNRLCLDKRESVSHYCDSF